MPIPYMEIVDMSQDIINGTHKGCCACKRDLPLRCFEKDASRRSGYLSRCKDCYKLLRTGKSDPVLRGRSTHERNRLDGQGLAPCYVCNQVKQKDSFYKDKTKWNGVSNRCISCHKSYQKKRLQGPEARKKQNACARRWRENNPEKVKAYFYSKKLDPEEKARRKSQRDEKLKRDNEIRRGVKFLRGISSYKSKISFCAECGKPFRKKISTHINCSKKCTQRRSWRNEYKKYSTNELVRLKTIMRVGIRRAARGEGIVGAWRYLKGMYTPKQLAEHLRSTLPDGYSWGDFMDGTLHIDHIRPLSWFDIKEPGDAEFLKCWALDNLQLLPGADNVRKGNRWEG